MERSHSLPVRSSGAIADGDGVTNPFYSQKLKDSMAVRAARPRDLPPTPVVESEEMVSGMGTDVNQLERLTGVKPGKGRGVQPIGTGRGVFPHAAQQLEVICRASVSSAGDGRAISGCHASCFGRGWQNHGSGEWAW